MRSDLRPCPIDKKPLVELASPSGNVVDISVWYCPHNDVAFVLLSRPSSFAWFWRFWQAPSMLQWHRLNGQLELREKDRKRWERLPRQFREAWESNVRYHAKCFIERRPTEPELECAMDRSSIPTLQESDEGALTPWRFGWCRYCRMGFLYAFDKYYGWEHCADVILDSDTKKFMLHKQHATAGSHLIEPAVISQLRPLPKWCWHADPP